MPSPIAIPRPGADEYFEYYDKYIRMVPGDDALPTLAGHFARWTPALRSLAEAQALHRYAPGKWSVKEVLGHVSDSERVFAYRLLRIARGDGTPLAGFDEKLWAANAPHHARPLDSLPVLEQQPGWIQQQPQL